jgi:chlorobactene glucosyltransferase
LVTSLLAQDYRHFELIILDDNSSDGTKQLARNAANGDKRFSVMDGQTLPTGWAGKNWACHQLSQRANGEILLFTDADTLWQPNALSALVAHMQTTRADLATVWSTQITESWGERLIVPLVNFVILGYLPIVMTHFSPFAMFGAANGQCMAWRKNAYQQVGGHAAVADNVLEDVTLARRAKSFGLRLRMAEGNALISCRMYDDWQGVRDGFAKNILAGHGQSVVALVASALFHLILFVLPVVLLLVPSYAAWGLAMQSLGIGTRALSAFYSQQRLVDALLMPVSVLLMTRIALQSIHWHFNGGMRWKGRQLTPTQDTLWQAKPPSSSAQGLAD